MSLLVRSFASSTQAISPETISLSLSHSRSFALSSTAGTVEIICKRTRATSPWQLSCANLPVQRLAICPTIGYTVGMLRTRQGTHIMPLVATRHLFVDAYGVAWIANTTTKVIEVVLDQAAFGLSAAQIHAEHPHLSLAQVHAALSYYYDHKSELDDDIAHRQQEAEQLRSQTTGQLTRAQLEQRQQRSKASSG